MFVIEVLSILGRSFVSAYNTILTIPVPTYPYISSKKYKMLHWEMYRVLATSAQQIGTKIQLSHTANQSNRSENTCWHAKLFASRNYLWIKRSYWEILWILTIHCWNHFQYLHHTRYVYVANRVHSLVHPYWVNQECDIPPKYEDHRAILDLNDPLHSLCLVWWAKACPVEHQGRSRPVVRRMTTGCPMHHLAFPHWLVASAGVID